MYGAASYPPPTPPGFQRAYALGLLPPPPPAVPPAVRPGLSSWDRLRLALGLCFGGILLGLLLGNGFGYPGVLQRWDGPGWKPLPQYWWHHESSYFRAPEVPFL
ncbi:MAG: hypothetical protein JWM62_2961 [Frankiales bacterium]|nr:hypothetical protein [Frankiales bacterium]